MEPINSFFPHLNVQLFQQYLKKKGLNNLAFNFFFIVIKKLIEKWASFIIFLYMHRNMLLTRLENQEGRDRLKCLAIYVHQKTSSDKSMKDGVQNTWDSLELGSQELKEWRGQWPLQPETQRHPHISTTAKVGRASPFWYSLLFFKFLLLHQNFQRLNFFPSGFQKNFYT